MLELRPACEHCNRALPPERAQAWICSFERIFCGGGFMPRAAHAKFAAAIKDIPQEKR